MIKYDEFKLNNGLQVIVHEDPSLPIAAFNLMYKVGSRDENPDKTGFAHLFEHLMFGGSGNIPVFDEFLQKVGGENNAFTTPDITNYYMTLPAINLETAFWLESDRMLIVYSGKKLEPFTRYFWSVQVQDMNSIKSFPAIAYFETGMMEVSGWTGSRISDGRSIDTRPAPYFRKEFDIKRGIKSARAYIAAGDRQTGKQQHGLQTAHHP